MLRWNPCTLILAMAFVLACLPAHARATGGDSKKAGDRPGTLPRFEPIDVQGVLFATDPVDTVMPGPCRLFRVPLYKGKSYAVNLMSNNFDSYLRLEDAAGKELARDDDGGGFPHARIVFTPLVDGMYQVVATSLNGQAGQFTLRVHEQGQAAVPVVKALILGKDGLKMQDRLNLTDPRDAVRGNSVCKLYTLPLKAGKGYQIDMQSAHFDSYLRLEDKNGARLAEDDDSGGFPHARIVFNCQQAGDYRVVATQFAGGQGDFTLQVQEK